MRLLQHQWGLNGDIGDISPVDIGHEMDPVLAKRGRERKGLIKGSNGSFKGMNILEEMLYDLLSK